MNYKILYYFLTTALVLAGATLVLLHYPFGHSILSAGLLTYISYQSWQINQLKKRIKELETPSTNG